MSQLWDWDWPDYAELEEAAKRRLAADELVGAATYRELGAPIHKVFIWWQGGMT